MPHAPYHITSNVIICGMDVNGSGEVICWDEVVQEVWRRMGRESSRLSGYGEEIRRRKGAEGTEGKG